MLKKKLLRCAAIFLTVAMTIPMAACGNNQTDNKQDSPVDSSADGSSASSENVGSEAEKEESEENEEPLKFSIIPYGQGFDTNDSPVVQMLEERFNVDIEVIPVDIKESETFSLFFAQGGVSDVYVFGPNSVWKDVISQGMLRTIEYDDMLEYMPTAMKISQESAGGEEKLRNMCKATPYVIPHIGLPLPAVMAVRKDWMDKVGIKEEELNSMEGLERLCHAFTYDDPDGNGIDDTCAFSGGGDFKFSYVFGAYQAYPTLYMLEDGQPAASFTTDRYKELLHLLNDWCEKGYFTEEAATDNRAAERSKWAEGTNGILFDNPWWFESSLGDNGVSGMLKAQNPDAEIAYIPCFEGPYGGGSLAYVYNYIGGDCTIGFDVDCSDEVVHKVMEIVEALTADKDLAMYCRYGVEGEDYTMEDGLVTVLNPNMSVEEKAEKGLGAFSLEVPSWELRSVTFTEEDGGIYDISKEINEKYGTMTMEVQYVLTETNEIRSEKNTDINTLSWRYFWDAILGNVDIDATWDSYLKELDDAGLGEILARDSELLVK